MHPIYPIDDQGRVCLKPIGAVRSAIRDQQTGGFLERESQVVVDPSLEPLLLGIDDFSHLLVVFWLSEVREHSVQRHPQGREDVPVLGMLATR